MTSRRISTMMAKSLCYLGWVLVVLLATTATRAQIPMAIPELGLPLSTEPADQQAPNSVWFQRTIKLSYYGVNFLEGWTLNATYDQPLHLLDGFFCSSMLNRSDLATCLAHPVIAPGECSPPCDFVSQCPPPVEDTCCYQRYLKSALPWSPSFCAPSVHPLNVDPAVPLMLTNITSAHPLEAISSDYPSMRFKFYVSPTTACSYAGFRVRVRCRIGETLVSMSKAIATPLNIRTNIGATIQYPIWRAHHQGPGDDRTLDVCLDQATAGAGTYFISVSCPGLQCVFDLAVVFFDFDNSTLTAVPVQPTATCEPPSCQPLTDGVPQTVLTTPRTPFYAAVDVTVPELFFLRIYSPWLSFHFYLTLDASDPWVEVPQYTMLSPSTTATVALSFLSNFSTWTFPVRVSLKIVSSSTGSIELLATSRAVFRRIPLSTLPPLTARFKLIGTSYLKLDNSSFYCPVSSVYDMPIPTAIDSVQFCDRRFWPVAPSDPFSFNPLISSYMDAYIPSIFLVPYDFTPVNVLRDRVALNYSYTAFWLAWWVQPDHAAVEYFPATTTVNSLMSIGFLPMIVGPGGFSVPDPRFLPIITNTSDIECDAERFVSSLTRVYEDTSHVFFPLYVNFYPGNSLDPASTFFSYPTFANRTTEIAIMLFSDWYTNCSYWLQSNFVTSASPFINTNQMSRTCVVTQPHDVRIKDPCCNVSLQYEQPCLFANRSTLTFDISLQSDPQSNCSASQILTNSDCYIDHVTYPVQRAHLNCSSSFCSGEAVQKLSTVNRLFLNNPQVGGCFTVLSEIVERVVEFQSATCFQEVFGISPVLGQSCSSDADCAAISAGAQCDLRRQRCLAPTRDQLRHYFQCQQDQLSPADLRLFMRTIGFWGNVTNIDEIMDWLYSPGSFFLSETCTVARTDWTVPFSQFVQFNVDRTCTDERYFERAPVLTDLTSFTPVSLPFLTSQYQGLGAPSEFCPTRQVILEPASCNTTAACNWHSAIGCTSAEEQLFCDNADFSEASCPAWIAASTANGTVTSPTNPAPYFCGYCNWDRCTLLPQYPTEAACLNASICEYQGGVIAPCPAGDATSWQAAGWCSRQCPGQSCTSAAFGSFGACVGWVDPSTCLQTNGMWQQNAQYCRYYLARSASECPAPLQWVNCNELDVAQCQSFGSTAPALQAIAKCFVDNWRPCSAAECGTIGGACLNESYSEFHYSIPRNIDADLPVFDMQRDPLTSNQIGSTSLFQNFFTSPPIWGVCIFNELGRDILAMGRERYCRQFPLDNAATIPRQTVAEGCIDYSFLNATSCVAAGGRWRLPAQDAATCEAPNAAVNYCIGRFTYNRANYDPELCEVYSAEVERSRSIKPYYWQAGRWQLPQPRKTEWIARSYAPLWELRQIPSLLRLNLLLDNLEDLYSQQRLVSFYECIYGSLLTPQARVICNCAGNALVPGCTSKTVGLSSQAALSVCSDTPLISFALAPITFNIVNFSTATVEGIGEDVCLGLEVGIAFSSDYLTPPEFSTGGFIANQVQSLTDGLNAVVNYQGRRVGYLTGDGFTMTMAPYYNPQGQLVPLPLSTIPTLNQLCFSLNIFYLTNFTFHPPLDFSLAGQPLEFDLAIGQAGQPLHPYQAHLASYQTTADETGTVTAFLCFDSVPLPPLTSGTVLFFPILREAGNWQQGTDTHDLSTLGVAVYSALTACYGLVALFAVGILVLMLGIQRAPYNPTHSVLVGMALFLTVRTVYFGILSANKTNTLPPVVDYLLIQLPEFILAGTFLIMLVYWSIRKQGSVSASDAEAIWRPRMWVLCFDGLLALIFLMFVLLFAFLPATNTTNAYLCSDAATTQQGSQRSPEQARVQIASQAFVVSVCLLLACMFAYNSWWFIHTLPANERASLFVFKRASRVQTAAEFRAKFFQTTVLLTLFFASDSIFLLIFYLFTSFHASWWCAIVLFFLEVVPSTFVIYQLHPKWTMVALYRHSKGPDKYHSQEFPPPGSNAEARVHSHRDRDHGPVPMTTPDTW